MKNTFLRRVWNDGEEGRCFAQCDFRVFAIPDFVEMSYFPFENSMAVRNHCKERRARLVDTEGRDGGSGIGVVFRGSGVGQRFVGQSAATTENADKLGESIVDVNVAGIETNKSDSVMINGTEDAARAFKARDGNGFTASGPDAERIGAGSENLVVFNIDPEDGVARALHGK